MNINIDLDEWYKQLLFYLFIGGLLSFIIIKIIHLLSNWIKYGGSLKSKAITIQGAYNIHGKKEKPVHATCPHSHDIMRIVERTVEFSELKHRSYSDLVEKQMKFYEEKEVEFQSLLLKTFVKQLSNHLREDVEIVQHPEYLNYIAILNAIGRVIKDYIRSVMRQNHFDEVDGDDWVEKKTRYRIMIMEKGTELLNLYWRGIIISRSQLHNINYAEDVISKLYIIIDDVFEYAKTEARKNNELLNKLREGYEVFLQDTVTG